ncbi:MAG: hypothetical protein ACRC6H_03420 [Culicoidibacterales bacterium]
MTAEQPKKSLFTRETKILLTSYVVEMILIFANLGVLLIGKQTNVLLVIALLVVSLFTYIYAKRLKKANKLIK